MKDRDMSTRHSPVDFLTRYRSSLLSFSKAGRILDCAMSTLEPPKTRGRACAAERRTRKDGSSAKDKTAGSTEDCTSCEGMVPLCSAAAPPTSASKLAAVILRSSCKASASLAGFPFFPPEEDVAPAVSLTSLSGMGGCNCPHHLVLVAERVLRGHQRLIFERRCQDR